MSNISPTTILLLLVVLIVGNSELTMSLDTQVALARPPRGESTHLSRAARQGVPPFLQKLYEFVDSATFSGLPRSPRSLFLPRLRFQNRQRPC